MQLGDYKGTLGFFLLQIADIYGSKRLTINYVKGIVLSNRDEFFGTKGNRFLRSAFNFLDAQSIVMIDASHANIAIYHDEYHAALQSFAFFT